MKQTIFFLVFSLIATLGLAQGNYYHPMDWEMYEDFTGISKQFSSVENQTYELTGDLEKGSLLSKSYIELDSENRVYKWEFSNLEMEVSFTQFYEYAGVDDDRIVTREHYGEHGELVEKTIYNYDKEHSDMITEIEVEEYNKLNPEEVDYSFTIDVELDEMGVRQKHINYKPDGSVRNEIRFNYNKMGFVSSKNRYSPDGEWQWTDSIEYNPLMKKASKLTIRPGLNEGETRKIKTKYDYFDNGLISYMKVGDVAYIYYYEYDDNDNWIKRETFKLVEGEEVPWTVTERNIHYSK